MTGTNPSLAYNPLFHQAEKLCAVGDRNRHLIGAIDHSGRATRRLPRSSRAQRRRAGQIKSGGRRRPLDEHRTALRFDRQGGWGGSHGRDAISRNLAIHEEGLIDHHTNSIHAGKGRGNLSPERTSTGSGIHYRAERNEAAATFQAVIDRMILTRPVVGPAGVSNHRREIITIGVHRGVEYEVVGPGVHHVARILGRILAGGSSGAVSHDETREVVTARGRTYRRQ